jgi:hypothetical protein
MMMADVTIVGDRRTAYQQIRQAVCGLERLAYGVGLVIWVRDKSYLTHVGCAR